MKLKGTKNYKFVSFVYIKFTRKCYIIDLKTALKEKDAQILKLQKKVEELEQKQAANWNFGVNFSDSD